MSKIVGILLLVIALAFFGWRLTMQSTQPVKRATPQQKDNLGRKVDFKGNLAEVSREALFERYSKPEKETVSTKLNFIDWTADSGIHFRHNASRTPEKFLPEVMGAGVVVADFNRDGAPDIFAINGGSVKACPARPEDIPNRLFLNDGQGRFRDASDEWNVVSFGFGMGGAAADYNNDGWIDLYLTSWGGGERLLRNEQGRGFVDVTAESGLEPDGRWSTSSGFFDFNQDGHLDLYVARYIDYTLENAIKCYFNNYHVYCAPLLYRGVADRLYRNNGDGTFTDVTATAFPAESLLNAAAGTVQDASACKGLAVALGDLNNDGLTDIYVANDASRNFLFVNRGDGTFEEIGRTSGVAYGENGMEQSGMGAALSDVNNNGLLDVACTNFQSETTNLYSQDSSLGFVDRTDEYGIGETSRARLSFGVCFFDADNNSEEDLVVANGHIFDNVEKFSSDIRFGQINSLYEAQGGGKFKDVTLAGGSAFEDAQVSRGLAVADFDSDGRIDFVVANSNGTLQLAKNETVDTGNFVSLWLECRGGNTNAIGTKVVVNVGDKKLIRHVYGASSFLAVNDWKMHIGLEASEKIDSLEIYWPGIPEPQILKDIPCNHFYYIFQGASAESYQPGAQVRPYESVSSAEQ